MGSDCPSQQIVSHQRGLLVDTTSTKGQHHKYADIKHTLIAHLQSSLLVWFNWYTTYYDEETASLEEQWNLNE